MYESILIPLDGSTLAEQVVPYAAALAGRFGSRVRLVQVVPRTTGATAVGVGGYGDMGVGLPVEMQTTTEVLEAQVREASEYLERVARRLREQGIADVAWEVRRGAPAEGLVQYAQEQDVSLIALSTHGRSGLGRLVFGSVADRVLRESGKPVLLIKSASDRKKGTA